MTDAYKGKVFKSGNSLALRLPKALGLREGEDLTLVPHADGSFSFWRASDAKHVFMALYGAFSSGFLAEGRGDTEQVDRNWHNSAHGEAA